MKHLTLPRVLKMAGVVLAVAFASLATTQSSRAAEAGAVSGTVSNATTGNLLEGVLVKLSGSGLTAFTDNTGRFVLTGVPVGTHELVATYIGLDPVRSEITLRVGERAIRNFELTSGIYRLQEFRVTGEREGGAAAITAQRNAANLANVIAMDSYGNLPNMSIGEVVMRLPGVAGSPNDEGSFANFSIRGMPAELNTVTIDGGFVATEGTSRALDMRRITGAIFDQLELIKGHTPDKGANSLGGTVNLKTRSPFKMRERRRINYSLSARVAPSFTEQIPLREQHRAHPMITLGYQEIFDVLGGSRNLAVNVNMFYSEDALGFFQTTRDFQNTTNPTAYVWDYRTFDNYNNSKQASINLRTDYQLSPATRISVSALANDY
ncbi:MAG: carboxypeptidase regulatory-like domain-containing protein, partial [Opitutaceae bacterium]